MSYNEEDEFDSKKAEDVLASLQRGEHPYLDIDDIENIYDALIEKGDTNGADLLTSYAVSLHPDDIGLLVMRANTLIDICRFGEAEELLNYMKSYDNEVPEVYISFGWLNLKQNNITVALKHFDRAVSLCSKDDEYLINEIAMNLNSLELFEQAEKYARLFTAKCPKNTDGLFELAYACEKNNKELEAIQLYNNLLEIDPFMELAWFNLGAILMAKNDYERALQAFQTASAINPENADAYINMGNCSMGMSKFDDALNYYTDYLSYCNKEEYEATVYMFIGECWENKEDYAMSFKFFDLFTRLDPETALGWYGKAYNASILKDDEVALEAISKALQILPEEADYYFLMAQILQNINDTDHEIMALLKGLELNPRAFDAWEEIYNLLYKPLKNKSDITEINNELRQIFGAIAELDFFLAFVGLQTNNEVSDALSLLDELAKNHKDILGEANENDTFKAIFSYPEVISIINKKGVIL